MLFVEIERHALEHLFDLRMPRRHDGNPFTTSQIKSGREVTIVHQVPSRDAVHHHARDALEHLTALDVDCLTALTVLNMHLLTIDNESILIGRNIFPPQLLLIGEIQIARRPHFIVQERDSLHLGETACDACYFRSGGIDCLEHLRLLPGWDTLQLLCPKSEARRQQQNSKYYSFHYFKSFI